MKIITIKGFDYIKAKGTYDKACALVKKANDHATGGYTDWVMPDTITLLALQKIAPADEWVWSSSPYVGNFSDAWVVYFGDGYVTYYGRNDSGLVRLVRASQLLELGDLGRRASIEAAGIVLPEQPAQQRKPLTDKEVWTAIRPLTKSHEDSLGAAIFARAFIGLESYEKDYLAESIEGREFSKTLLQFMTYNRYKYDRVWRNDCNAAQVFEDAGATYAELIAMAPLFLRTRIFNELTAYIDMTQGAHNIKV